MEQNENKTKTIAEVANGIKRDLRTIFDSDGEYYAMLYLIKRLVGLDGCVGFNKILEWWLKALEEGKSQKTNGVTILDLTMNAYHFALAVQKASRYFKFVSGQEYLVENDEPYGDDAIQKTRIGLSDNFRKYINSITEEDKKVLRIDLTFKYSEVVFKSGMEKAINVDGTEYFGSRNETIESEVENDEILKDFSEPIVKKCLNIEYD